MVDITERLRLNGTDWVFGDTAITALKEIQQLRIRVAQLEELLNESYADADEVLRPTCRAIKTGGTAVTDKELLELAAKAAEVELTWDGSRWDFSKDPAELVGWNPLTDDGDALRLAVKLNMGISIPIHRTIRADVITFRDALVNVREEGDDPYAATRRAIVRAAAELGRNLK